MFSNSALSPNLDSNTCVKTTSVNYRNGTYTIYMSVTIDMIEDFKSKVSITNMEKYFFVNDFSRENVEVFGGIVKWKTLNSSKVMFNSYIMVPLEMLDLFISCKIFTDVKILHFKEKRMSITFNLFKDVH